MPKKPKPRKPATGVRGGYNPPAGGKKPALPTTGSGVVQAQLPAAPLTDSQAFIAMIERAARDPAVDTAKLKELLAMKNEEQDRVARAIYTSAMQAAQEEMEPVRRDCTNDQTRSKYASYEAMDHALRPIYSKHGFGLSFSTEPSGEKDLMRVTCKVMHRAGHMEHHQIDIPIVTVGPKGNAVMTPTHATMSAKSYGKRGLVDMIFNVATTDVRMDDDGNAASGQDVADEDQIKTLQDAMKAAGLPLDKFELAFGKLDMLPANRVAEALDRINQFAKRGFQKAE